MKSASKENGTKSTRLEADGGFVDLVSTLEGGGIDQVEAVRHARHAVNDKEFARAQGIFSLGDTENLAQSMSVQVYGRPATGSNSNPLPLLPRLDRRGPI